MRAFVFFVALSLVLSCSGGNKNQHATTLIGRWKILTMDSPNCIDCSAFGLSQNRVFNTYLSPGDFISFTDNEIYQIDSAEDTLYRTNYAVIDHRIVFEHDFMDSTICATILEHNSTFLTLCQPQAMVYRIDQQPTNRDSKVQLVRE